MTTGRAPFSSAWGLKYRTMNRLEFLIRTTKNPSNQPHPTISWLLDPITISSTNLTISGVTKSVESVVIISN